MTKALLLSNSTMPGTEFFTWPQPYVKSFLDTLNGYVAFVPFAAVTISFDEYTEKVRSVFNRMGYELKSVHEHTNSIGLVESASAVLVGGGNSFALLHRLYEARLVDLIREKITGGAPYVGWSAGANLGCPTIMTTNDMPVVQPVSLKALGLIPFQINPHYHELKFEGQGGETRRERLEEFIQMNPEKRVIGLPEGMFVKREGKDIMLGGVGVAKLYQQGEPVKEVPVGEMLHW